jgi:hypothetical protein
LTDNLGFFKLLTSFSQIIGAVAIHVG